jgi:hypothetical protein
MDAQRLNTSVQQVALLAELEAEEEEEIRLLERQLAARAQVRDG